MKTGGPLPSLAKMRVVAGEDKESVINMLPPELLWDVFFAASTDYDTPCDALEKMSLTSKAIKEGAGPLPSAADWVQRLELTKKMYPDVWESPSAVVKAWCKEYTYMRSIFEEVQKKINSMTSLTRSRFRELFLAIDYVKEPTGTTADTVVEIARIVGGAWPKNMLDHYQTWRLLIDNYEYAFELATFATQNNKRIALYAIKKDLANIDRISFGTDALFGGVFIDKDFWKEALSFNGLIYGKLVWFLKRNPFAYRLKTLYRDNELMLAAVKQNGLALKYMFTRNLNVVLTAVRQNGAALEFAPHDFRTDPVLKRVAEENKGEMIDFSKSEFEWMR